MHVVIIGLTKRAFEPQPKRLFSYDNINGDPVESRHRVLSPYLFDASNLRDRHLVVEEQAQSLDGGRKLISGSQPIDDGYYIFDFNERMEFLKVEPSADQYLKPYIGSEEYINGGQRWILSLQSATPQELRAMPAVMERMRLVREFRSRSKRTSTLKIADSPTRYNVEVLPRTSFLVIPEVSSERREYVPIGWLNPPTIPSNLVRILPDANLEEFGILTSAMHMAWLRNIGGRLESRYRYSIGIVYNCFPWPEVSEAQKAKIRELAQAVLDARAKFPDAALADLYDPDSMPPELRKAHHKLDDAVDALYKRGGFQSDRERVEHLFALYEKLVQPLTARTPKENRRKKIS